MKNWLTIGQFAKRTGFSAKALRLYEKKGLIISHARGDNDYRYFAESQLTVAKHIKELKDLGFTLNEIKDLLKIDQKMTSEKMKAALLKRRDLISLQADVLRNQKDQVDKILSSLNEKSPPLKAEQRRAIMSFYGKVSILVTGVQGLEKTARHIQELFQKNGAHAPIYHWKRGLDHPAEKPFIVIVPEDSLVDAGVECINADTVVVKNLSEHSKENTKSYLRLFTKVGPHVTTVFNADDLASVKLAAEESIRKGRIFYFSKNGNLEEQIKSIGGIVSDGEEVTIYGFNLKKDVHEFKFNRVFAYEDEMAYLAGLGSVLTLDFKPSTLMP